MYLLFVNHFQSIVQKSLVLFLWETSFLVFNFLLQERKVLIQIWDIVFEPFKNPANGSCLSSTTWSFATINAYSYSSVIITLTIAIPELLTIAKDDDHIADDT